MLILIYSLTFRTIKGGLMAAPIIIAVAIFMTPMEASSEAILQNGMIAGSVYGERQIVSWFAENDAMAQSARESSKWIAVYLDEQGYSSQSLSNVVITVHAHSVMDGRINPESAPFASDKHIMQMNGLIAIDGGCGYVISTLGPGQNIIFIFVFLVDGSAIAVISKSAIDQCAIMALKAAEQK